MARHHLIPAAAVVLGSVAAGCSDDPSIDPVSLVDGLPAAVVPDEPEVVTDVVCPDPEAGVVAQSLVCTAAIHGETVTVDLVVDEDGVVAATAREPLLDLGEVETTASTRLTDDLGTEVVVRCPGTVAVAAAGVEIACTGTSGGRTTDLVVAVAEGGEWSVAFAP